MTVTADTTKYTADSHYPTADGFVPAAIAAVVVEVADAVDNVDAASIVSATILEPAVAIDDVDAAVGANILSATVFETADAADVVDATVEAAAGVVGGGRYYPRLRPFPIEGVGYGILPELEGEAHGIVGVAGQSAAQVLVRADAIGACGQAGNAAVVLKSLSVAGNGAVGIRGSGDGMIVKFNGTATGRHDDDEAAVIAFLLAA